MYDQTIHNRRSVRLDGFDYSNPEFYFITICTENKKCIFGHIHDGKMTLNDWGKIVQQCLLDIPRYNPRAILYEYIIMPNHIHFIMKLNEMASDGCNRAQICAPTNPTDYAQNILVETGNSTICVGAHTCAPHKSRFGDKLNYLAKTIRGFKAGVTQQIGHLVWQRNYYEHIIRDGNEHEQIRNYIQTNPQTWDTDKLFVKNITELKRKLGM